MSRQIIEDKPREQTYQWLLRSIGAFLDEEPSCRVTIMETPDGFVVRMQTALHRVEGTIHRLQRETLVEELRRRQEARPPSPAHFHHQGVWAHFPNGHQDFLRALGYELDEARARNILIDELEDGVAVVYTAPAEKGAWQKRMVTLGESEIEEILNSAFARRGQPKVGK